MFQMTEGETSPPSLLTEADLISLMDKHGIGVLTNISTRFKSHDISLLGEGSFKFVKIFSIHSFDVITGPKKLHTAKECGVDFR